MHIVKGGLGIGFRSGSAAAQQGDGQQRRNEAAMLCHDNYHDCSALYCFPDELSAFEKVLNLAPCIKPRKIRAHCVSHQGILHDVQAHVVSGEELFQQFVYGDTLGAEQLYVLCHLKGVADVCLGKLTDVLHRRAVGGDEQLAFKRLNALQRVEVLVDIIQEGTLVFRERNPADERIRHEPHIIGSVEGNLLKAVTVHTDEADTRREDVLGERVALAGRCKGEAVLQLLYRESAEEVGCIQEGVVHDCAVRSGSVYFTACMLCKIGAAVGVVGMAVGCKHGFQLPAVGMDVFQSVLSCFVVSTCVNQADLVAVVNVNTEVGGAVDVVGVLAHSVQIVHLGYPFVF